MRFPRVLQIGLGVVFGLFTLAGAVTAAMNWHRGPSALIIFIVPLVLLVASVGAFQLQFRLMRKHGERVRAAMDAIAAKVFDAPAAVRPGYDMTVTSGAMGAAASAMEVDTGFTADGRCRGARVSVASHASTLGRQVGEFVHVYSHVVVDMQGYAERFHLTKQGAGSMIARAAGMKHDVKVGDAAFDQAWNIDADEDVAREALAPSVRARLMELRARVGAVSQDFGVGTMSVILTPHGLAIRWPGPIDPALAVFMRDLLLDMRERILAYEDRKAARAGAGGDTYRVAAETGAAAEALPEDEAAEKARAKA